MVRSHKTDTERAPVEVEAGKETEGAEAGRRGEDDHQVRVRKNTAQTISIAWES